MQALAQAKGRTERREATGVRQALALSSAGHLVVLAACLLLGSGVPKMTVPMAIDVVLVAAGGAGTAASTGSERAKSVGTPALPRPAPGPLGSRPGRDAKRPDRRKVASPPRSGERRVDAGESVPPRRSAAPMRPEAIPFRTESVREEGFAATVLPPEGGHTPVIEIPTGAAPAGGADVPAEARRDGDFEGSADAGGLRGTQSAALRGGDGSGTSPGAASTAATLRDAIQSRIVYPEEAVRRGLEGEVLLRIRIGKGGNPGEIRVAKSSGARILDEAARHGVIRASPLPSAPGWVDVPVRFVLLRPAGERR